MREQRVRAKTRVKPGIWIGATALLFLVLLSITTVTHSTPQFLIWLSLTCIGSVIGFVTMAALGF
jgi:ABC-type Na+ efflux pump permease subunit